MVAAAAAVYKHWAIDKWAVLHACINCTLMLRHCILFINVFLPEIFIRNLLSYSVRNSVAKCRPLKTRLCYFCIIIIIIIITLLLFEDAFTI